jgi:hypothetical protein
MGDVLNYTTVEDFVQAMPTTSPILHYVEAQYHGEVTLADVQEVIFHKDPPSQEMRRLLEENGIPYRETWQKASNASMPNPNHHEGGGTR